MKGTVIAVHPAPDKTAETASVGQYDGIAVTEYMSPCGTHGDHIDVLALIEGKWMTVATWRKLAEEKLGINETYFEVLRGNLEASHCICLSTTGDDLKRIDPPKRGNREEFKRVWFDMDNGKILPMDTCETYQNHQRIEMGDDYDGLVSAVKQEIPVPPEWSRLEEEARQNASDKC